MNDPPAGPESASPPSDLWLTASDKLLLLGARRRDEDALAGLFDRYGSLVFALALRILGDRADAEAVMQDVFLDCWHSLERFDDERGSFVSWLMGITRSRAIAERRLRQRPEPSPGHDIAPGAGPSEAALPAVAEDTASWQGSEHVLSELPDPQREAIQLAYFHGLSRAEMADRMGQSVEIVSELLRNGLRQLRQQLQSETDSQHHEEASAHTGGAS